MTIEFSHEQKIHFKFELEIEGFTCTKRQDNDTWESMHVTKGEGTRTNSVLPSGLHIEWQGHANDYMTHKVVGLLVIMR